MRGIFLSIAFAAFAAFAEESKAIRCDFSSQPEGATVVVDGVTRGVTPLTLYDLAPGSRHVRFELANYDGVDEFMSLREGGAVSKNAVLRPINGILLLVTEPEGCDVSLDGMSLGTTPRLITSLAAKDTYRLLVQKPGYQPRTVEVKFNGRTPLVKNESLVIDSGVIEVTSEPAGAEVTVNGNPRGRTPVKVDGVPKGRATVSLKKNGFAEESRELAIVAGESQTLFVKLTGLPGTMLLSSVPDGARFYVNDRPEGVGPISLTGLVPGRYTIRVEKEGFATVTKTVLLENGGSIVKEFRLDNVMGRIEVRTVPSDVDVFLDGSRIGTTKSKGEDCEVSEALTIENVHEGEHTLVLKREGYADVTRHPVVENRKTRLVNAILKRVFTPNVEITTDGGVHRGVLISNTPAGVEVELSLGIKHVIPHSEIRKLEFIK